MDTVRTDNRQILFSPGCKQPLRDNYRLHTFSKARDIALGSVRPFVRPMLYLDPLVDQDCFEVLYTTLHEQFFLWCESGQLESLFTAGSVLALVSSVYPISLLGVECKCPTQSGVACCSLCHPVTLPIPSNPSCRVQCIVALTLRHMSLPTIL